MKRCKCCNQIIGLQAMGGRAKASKMTKEERTAHAMKMVRARLSTGKDLQAK